MSKQPHRDKVLSSLDELAGAGLVNADPRLEAVEQSFAVGLTRTLARQIGSRSGEDRPDPVALQFIPAVEELEVAAEELTDPIGDAARSPVPGIVHRYPDRALLKVTHLCTVYCRFCFRRELIGSNADAPLTPAQLDAALTYIDRTPELWEVILTGGDPLALSNRRLRDIVERLAAVPHLKVLRIHTRIPVADPARIDAELIELLTLPGLTAVIAIHANHAQEFGSEARGAVARLANAGITLRSQTVLLRGINDSVETLAELMRTFVELRISPYLLHHPDLARGTSHFRVSLAEGQALLRALRGRFSGLCQPDYVIDLPGGFGKVPVSPGYEGRDGEGNPVLTDYQGDTHPLPPNAQGNTDEAAAPQRRRGSVRQRSR
ncbi:MAG: lysine-2,3-aminomutase-like protein [Pseudomonadota bacterium]